MTIPVTCTCGKSLKIPEHYAGKRVKCPKCGSNVKVLATPSGTAPTPIPSTSPAVKREPEPTTTAVPPGMLRFNCSCGKQMQARDEYAGRMTKCPACGKQLPIPGEKAKPTATSAPAAGTSLEKPVTETSQKPARGLGSFSARTILLVALAPLVLVGAGVGAMWLAAKNDDGKKTATTPIQAPAETPADAAASGLPSLENLRQIGDAMMKYHQEHRKFPPAAVLGKDGRPLFSWRVELLPFLNEKALYDQVKKDEPWDGPTNKALWDRMPKVYALPDKPSSQPETCYQVFTGPKALFGGKLPPKLADISDIPAKTILIAEAAKPVNWMSPTDLVFNHDPAGYSPSLLGGHFGDLFHVIMADSTPLRINRSIKPTTLQAAITPAGREILGADWESAIVR